ncbi:hypothetical protein BU26DRAFT_522719 [Trematosphaeria pertusa]|uniref:Heterokaryon incompatibility domain-containing protein n=1 Tax=Trematosphaeria pertusa TaxID=390896 RepID=A0A6A6I493_9PLEO|nr:uncharacterized protein BU26DRAFT_522719 [Trematosphaeria pertusa]KAF2245029.1 hypothetical protein BU26DRAFT_522719 [Trematosphaeria pertusa]
MATHDNEAHGSTFDNNCRWPRRLLHLATLTSYPWEPGNRYGCYIEPEYFAISYTWGRWELEEGDYPGIPHLDFHTPWNIPRVNPNRFTQKQFIDVIQGLPKLSDKPIEFLWLDVACIDQRERSHEKAMEIGRQGVIFRGAYRVFAWLYTYNRSELRSISEQLASYWRYVWNPLLKNKATTEDIAEVVGNIISTLEKYTADPWFTSLWTLQEAYIRPDALLLDRDGDQWLAKINSISPRFSEEEVPIGVEDVFESFDMLYRAMNELPIFCHNQDLHGIRDRIEATGCAALKTRIPTILLSASQKRKIGPKNTNDRVYGIMQAFGLKLGVSEPDSPPHAIYDLETLEDQLGAKLMETTPAMSQLFTHSKPAPVGKAWRMSYNTFIPHLATLASSVIRMSSFETTTTLSTRNIGDTVVGHFSGPTCSIQQLVYPWREYHVNQQLTGYFGNSVGVALDDMVGLTPPLKLWKFFGVGEGEYSLVDWFKNEGLTVMVHMLGRSVNLPKNYAENTPMRAVQVVGLLLLRPEDAVGPEWRRLGICWWRIWDHDYMNRVEGNSSLATLAGKGDGWTLQHGTFG